MGTLYMDRDYREHPAWKKDSSSQMINKQSKKVVDFNKKYGNSFAFGVKPSDSST